MVTTYRQPKGRTVKTSRGKTTSTVSNGSYSQANKEPWILATNLPLECTPAASHGEPKARARSPW